MTSGIFLSHKTPAFFFKQALSKYGKVKNEKEVFHKIHIFQTWKVIMEICKYTEK